MNASEAKRRLESALTATRERKDPAAVAIARANEFVQVCRLARAARTNEQNAEWDRSCRARKQETINNNGGLIPRISGIDDWFLLEIYRDVKHNGIELQKEENNVAK